jgi:hypothetical protein
MVVRNEERFLARNLDFHRAMGVDHAFVFLDQCTDRSAAIAGSYRWVTPIVSDRQPEQEHMSTFQVACLREALERARAGDYDWMMHVDADEFARGESIDPASASLRALIRTVTDEVEQVVLDPVDALPTKLQPGEDFEHLTQFLVRGIIRRRMLDPSAGGMRRLQKRLGHRKGKAIVRTAIDARPVSAHRWIHNETRDPLITVKAGRLYHFVSVDARSWWEKHRKFAGFPSTWSGGKEVSFPKQAWKEAAPRMTRDEAETYFNTWVRYSASQLWWPRMTGRVVEDDFVRRVLEGLPQSIL